MSQRPLTDFFKKATSDAPVASTSNASSSSSSLPIRSAPSNRGSNRVSPHDTASRDEAPSTSRRPIRKDASLNMHTGGKGRGDPLRKIAEATLEAISTGRYVLDGQGYDLAAKTAAANQNVLFFPANSPLLSAWKTPPQTAAHSSSTNSPVAILFNEISTLEGARLLSVTTTAGSSSPPPQIGVLNFASAKKPGGGFLGGAQAQEESIARSSNIYPTLMTEVGQQFYKHHKSTHTKSCFYSHAMLFSPGVTLFRDDAGGWATPLDVDIVTSAAVNAGLARRELRGDPSVDAEQRIADEMRERMARVLYLFEHKGVRNLVLGSFGTGVFRNNVATVASIWADLLVGDRARFRYSFDKVVFAILGEDTFKTFCEAFEAQQTQRGVS